MIVLNWPTFVIQDQRILNRLFPFRPIILLLGLSFIFSPANAQLIDGILGQKRTVVQVLLHPYRIMDYEKDRVVYNVEKGIHQTVLYINDTCKQFYWAVSKEQMPLFKAKLLDGGYSLKAENKFVKDSLELVVRPLNSGKATLFMASLSEKLKLSGNRDATGKVIKKKRVMNLEAMPLLQQAILTEENDTTPKKPKDPERHWVGERDAKATILGWE